MSAPAEPSAQDRAVAAAAAQKANQARMEELKEKGRDETASPGELLHVTA